MTMQLAQAGLNLFIAACLGAAIGLERQWRQRLAGLRTNTLVALGAAIFVTYAHVADGLGDTRFAFVGWRVGQASAQAMGAALR